MKRVDFIRHLKDFGCKLDREGNNHSIWKNPLTNTASPLPRHNEIEKELVKIICKQLHIPNPKKK